MGAETAVGLAGTQAAEAIAKGCGTVIAGANVGDIVGDHTCIF